MSNYKEKKELFDWIQKEKRRMEMEKYNKKLAIGRNADDMLFDSERDKRINAKLKNVRDDFDFEEDKRLAEENNNFDFDEIMNNLPGLSDIEKSKPKYLVPKNVTQKQLDLDRDKNEDELESINAGTRRKRHYKKNKKSKKTKKSNKKTRKFRKSKK